jgi:hypothetical protein
MNRRILWTLPFLVLGFTTTTLHAQAKFAVYVTAGGEKTDVSNEPWTLAGTFGIYYGFTRLGPIALSADARGDLSRNMTSALFGPRVALSLPYFPIKPYFEVLGGVSTYSVVNEGPRDSTAGNYRWVGGVDSSIFPHTDWRIDYSYSGGGITQNNITRHPQSLTSGIVIRF